VVSILAMTAAQASAQNYPVKPIRIVTDEAGGGSDLILRMVAQGITFPLGQPVIVDNRGGGGTVSGEIAAHAAPDGYTLLMVAGTLWIGAVLRKLPFDPVKELSPITLAVAVPNLLIVNPTLPVTNVKELIALAKSKPGQLNYSSGATGASSHIAAELFRSMAGINIVRIPYKGSGSAVNAVIANEAQMMFPNAGLAIPHVKSGRLRALAVTTPQPSAILPGVPTIAASGLPGYESVLYTGMFAPANTPQAVIRRLNEVTVRYLRTPEAKERFLNVAGAEVVASTPEAFAAKIKEEIARISKLVKDGNIKIVE
jgi:tripartite-type tricarboxylate transporter receptor subunit TctC